MLIERRSADPVLRLDFFRIPRLHERERGRFRDELRPLRRLLLHRALPPGRGEVLGREDRAPVRRDGGRDGRRRPGSPGAGPPRRGPARADGGRLPARRRRDLRASTRSSYPNVVLWPLAAALAVVGFGLGLALVAVTASVLAIVPPERSGMAASTVNTSRELGGVLAVAILGAVINAPARRATSARKLGGARRARRPPAARRPRGHARRPAGERGARDRSRTRRRRGGAPHPGILGKILDAATASFGHGLHVGLVVAACDPARGRGRLAVRLARLPERLDRTSAMPRTASSSSAPDVPKFRRAKPRPCSPNVGPGLSATRPRSRNASAGSSPSPSSRQSSQAR